MRIVQISDTHLAHGEGVTTRNFERIVAYVNETLRPDLVIHTGDVIALTPDAPQDREFARSALTRLDVPVRVLPGNHDIGEAGEAPWMGITVTPERCAAHRAALGPDRFLETWEDWALVGLNSQLLGSGLEEEDEQWEWLERVLAGIRPGSRVILFLHQPLWAPRVDPSAGVLLSVPDSASQRLLALRGGQRIRAVASGHLHRYRRRVHDSLVEVWAPSTAFIGQTETHASHFEQLGVVEWKLGKDTCTAAFRAPHDLEELEVAAIPELMRRVDELRPPAREGATAR